MPPRAKRPCRHRGCAAVTNDVSGYCEIQRQQHIGDGWRNHQSGKSRQQRGYGRPWEIIRARILVRDKYLCQNCRRNGIATKAASVDHKIPKSQNPKSPKAQKPTVVLMTIPILNRCAGRATERKPQQREHDEEFKN